MMINTSKMKTDDIIKMLSELYDIKMGTKTLKGAYINQYLAHKNVSFEEEAQ